MVIMVIGGSASGKSEIAERYAVKMGGGLLYIATMEPGGPEAGARILRHRAQRDGLGFETLECAHSLALLRLLRRYDTVLLECLGNLTANEMFSAATPPNRVADAVIDGVQALAAQVPNVVLVTNDVFAGGGDYDGGMAAYLAALADVNRRAAERADRVVEVVCGLEIVHKKERCG